MVEGLVVQLNFMSHIVVESLLHTLYHGFLIWIDNTRLVFQPPTTARVTSSAVVKQTVIFTILQSLLRIHEKWKDTSNFETILTVIYPFARKRNKKKNYPSHNFES